MGERLGRPEGKHGVRPSVVTMEVNLSELALVWHFQELCIFLSWDDSLHSEDHVNAAI